MSGKTYFVIRVSGNGYIDTDYLERFSDKQGAEAAAIEYATESADDGDEDSSYHVVESVSHTERQPQQFHIVKGA